MNRIKVAQALVRLAKELVVGDGGKKFHWRQMRRGQYDVSFHDGEKTHKDGSEFYDMKILHNTKDLNAFLNQLRKQGYVED